MEARGIGCHLHSDDRCHESRAGTSKKGEGDIGGNLGSLKRLLHREGVSIKQKLTG